MGEVEGLIRDYTLEDEFLANMFGVNRAEVPEVLTNYINSSAEEKDATLKAFAEKHKEKLLEKSKNQKKLIDDQISEIETYLL